MTTYEQRELAGVSPINEPTLPTESKHESDEAYKKSHEMAIYQKELRELDNYQMMEYQHDLAETLDIRDVVKNELITGNYEIIDTEKARNVPYKRSA